MMISPEMYYEENIAGKSPAEVYEEISELEKEISELREIKKDKSNEAWMIHPSPDVRLSMARDYLKLARQGYNEAIQLMVQRLLEMPEGSEATTARLMLDIFGRGTDCFTGMFQVEADLRKEAGKAGLILDKSKHRNKVEGLPFNLDFKIKRKKFENKAKKHYVLYKTDDYTNEEHFEFIAEFAEFDGITDYLRYLLEHNKNHPLYIIIMETEPLSSEIRKKGKVTRILNGMGEYLPEEELSSK